MKNNPTQIRPLLFTTNPSKADMHFFVHGNTSQAYSVNIPTIAPRTAPSFLPNTSLFDRYHKTNLFLRDCDPRDITVLSKNIVAH